MAQVTAPLLDSTTVARHFGIRYRRREQPIPRFEPEPTFKRGVDF
jgi:hypothetical protein